MAVQTYIKKGNGYTAGITFGGADADQVVGVYQVYTCLIHEWGDPVNAFSKLAHGASAGDTEISVYDGSQFTAGNSVVFLDGNSESVTVSAVSDNTLTVSALSYNHNQFVIVAIEEVAVRTSANNYTATLSVPDLSAAGKHRVRWRYVQSGVSTVEDQYVSVYQQYIDSATFFTNYPDLEDEFEDFFDHAERVVRGKINTVCGQNFDYIPNKSLVVDGSGRNTVRMPSRIERFNTVYLKDDYSDITSQVEYDPTSKFYLRLATTTTGPSSSRPNWGSNSQFEIVGDWGWQSVPVEISMAAELLVADEFNEDSQYYKHGIVEAYMDTHRLRAAPGILDTVGNIDAETLILDYVLFSIGDI